MPGRSRGGTSPRGRRSAVGAGQTTYGARFRSRPASRPASVRSRPRFVSTGRDRGRDDARIAGKSPVRSPAALEGPLYIARSQYERPIEPAALPKELVDLTRHPYAEARVGAVTELSRLLASNNPGMRLSARLTLESMINDDSRKVSDRAHAALRERSITGPVAVEAVRQVPGRAMRTEPGWSDIGVGVEARGGTRARARS